MSFTVCKLIVGSKWQFTPMMEAPESGKNILAVGSHHIQGGPALLSKSQEAKLLFTMVNLEIQHLSLAPCKLILPLGKNDYKRASSAFCEKCFEESSIIEVSFIHTWLSIFFFFLNHYKGFF